jgi:iron complex outermembrane receptor protein
MPFSIRACVLAIFAALALQLPAAAQDPLVFTGRLIDSVSGQPVGGITIQLDEVRRQATSQPDGTFTITGLAAGTYHLSVVSPGYSSRRAEIVVPSPAPASASTAPVDIALDPELHFQDVVTVGATVRSQFESYQPTSVLAGQDLARQLEGSLGATLEQQPGLASRSLGPAASRPVVRGLDGDRVLILQDGQRIGDLSSQSGDHGVTVNPAAARRIEVVRGPATLLYGANAIGGLVNVLTDDIPTRPVTTASGSVTFDLGSAAGEGGGAGSIRMGNGRFALTAGGGGRRSGDVGTPLGAVANSQSRTGFGSLGLAWTAERGFLGASYGYDDTKYGIPVVEDGRLQLTPRRHAFSLRGGARDLRGVFDEVRGTLALRRYRHDEQDGGEVGTRFRNDTTELELMASHRPFGRLEGSVGGWWLDRRFDARGEEALSPAVDQRGLAAFVYEELTWPHVTFQFGARLDSSRFEPRAEPVREFTELSGSVGVLLRPRAADDRLTIAASLARAARSPAMEELFFFGLHHGNFAIELGNPELEPERGLGVDVSVRWRGPRASGEITWFRNDIANFIYRNELAHTDFELREDDYLARFPGRALAGHAHGEDEGEDLAIVDLVGADAVLQGVELHGDVQVAPRLFAEAGLDYVRGSRQAAGDPLPRMPPLRVRGGLRYQWNAFQAGGEVLGVSAQKRVSGAETSTGGYALLDLFASWSFTSGRVLNTITGRLDNATNRLYRSHLSLIKDQAPEMGRNAKVLYTAGF